MPTTASTPAEESKQIHDMIDGLSNNPLPGLTGMTLEGATYTIPALVSSLQSYAKNYDDAEAAEIAHAAAIQTRNGAAPAAMKLVSGIRRTLKTVLGRKSATLAEFGVTPDKEPTPLTAAQTVEKVTKTQATRVARHTMGPKQKAKIKGVVPPVTPPATPPKV